MKINRIPYSLTVLQSIFLATLVTVRADSDLHPSQYCRTIQCRTAAGEMLLSHNQSVNPCIDFYEHACGGWNKHQFAYLTSKINRELSELFKNIQSSDIETLKKSKQFYDACMDWEAISRRSLRPVEKLLADNGEWPVTFSADNWNPDNSIKWQEVHENFAKRTGVSSLFDVTVEIDRANISRRVITLTLSGIRSDRVQFINQTKSSEHIHSYETYFSSVIETFALLRRTDFEVGDLYDDGRGIANFEDYINRLNVQRDDEDNANEVSDLMSIEELQKIWDAAVTNDKFYAVRMTRNVQVNTLYSMDWLRIINDRFEGTGVAIDSSENVYLKPREFVVKLIDILNVTPLRTVVNYLHWKVVDRLLPFTNTRLLNLRLSRSSTADRSEICVKDHKMIHAVSYMYAKAKLDDRSVKAAREIVKQVQEEFKREIRNSSWLDETTKSLALEKIDVMTNIVGYPDWYDEPGKINEYYDELTVGPDYFDNVLAAIKFEAKKKLSKLRSPVSQSETEWILPSYIVNAVYDRQTNGLSLPAAILQPPLLAYEVYSALNYGSFGAIVGYEMHHGLDTKGQLYDKDGIQKKLWADSSMQTYETKAQCFVEQYKSYQLNDEQTKNITPRINDPDKHREYIADAVGFRAALRAYQIAKRDGGTNDLKIRLLRTKTDEQLYFYKLAHTMCESESNDRPIAHTPHSQSPMRFRIVAALSNMQEFADAFACPIGSPMNPLKKCIMWD